MTKKRQRGFMCHGFYVWYTNMIGSVRTYIVYVTQHTSSGSNNNANDDDDDETHAKGDAITFFFITIALPSITFLVLDVINCF